MTNYEYTKGIPVCPVCKKGTRRKVLVLPNTYGPEGNVELKGFDVGHVIRRCSCLECGKNYND